MSTLTELSVAPQSFAEFVWSAAQGYMLSLYQVKKGDAHPPQLRVPDSTLRAVVDAQEALQRAQAMSDEEAEATAKSEFEETSAYAARMTQQRLARRARYAAMLDKVKTWNPPTEAHTALRAGMIADLRSGLVCDCSAIPPPKPKTGQEYKAWRVQAEQARLDYAKTTLAEAQRRNDAGQAWIDVLHESIEREVEFERLLAKARQ